MLIDVAISGDRNVIKKEAEKILKYKDLTIEIQRMWNVKTKVIPVIIGAIGAISKSFRKYVSNIPGKHEVKELQKRAILGTAHIKEMMITIIIIIMLYVAGSWVAFLFVFRSTWMHISPRTSDILTGRV